MTGALAVTGPDANAAADRRTAWWLAALGAVLTVGLNIAYPLAGNTGRDRLSVLTVLVFAAASVAGAWAHGGARTAAAVLLGGGGIGLVAEVVGVSTGVPFGEYTYADSLGPKLAGVPLVVPLAWVMMAWPAWVVGTALAARAPVRRRRAFSWLTGAWALASWDVFLDPQMVNAGHWSWRTGSGIATAVPGIPDIPVSNYLGWLAVSLVLTGLFALIRLPGSTARAVPGPAAALYLWTWAGGILANAAFFGRPAVAVVAGLLMGVVAVPFAVCWRRTPRTRDVPR